MKYSSLQVAKVGEDLFKRPFPAGESNEVLYIKNFSSHVLT